MPKDVVRKVGRRIRELRQKKGWSQEKLAEMAGLHRTYIGQIERGEKSVGVENLLRVAEALCDSNWPSRSCDGLVGEYRALFDALSPTRTRPLERALVAGADWTPEAARHLVLLARDCGTFMLRNAAAIATALDIEDGELGF
jgi:transcriptional regulator with XRE-family HTH domain